MDDTGNSTTGFRSERSDSTSSASSMASPRRTSSHGLFEGLTAQKRKDDPASMTRRQSMNEQRPAVGFIGQMWNNWVRGK
ncbi:hypothetical protein B0H63DRAFT_298495 [Podospora didyma]|uniref:Conidiation-specific protein 8 n=1 Tax=Podospora didyma TaxID=330526 RepID=A0AAE0KAC7_9PEZI|nr:hypothetical protein B0H63DRAFT_298495 [Podospora didyma]